MPYKRHILIFVGNGLGKLHAQIIDCFLIVLGTKYSRPCHESVSTGTSYLPDVVDVHSAIDFQADIVTGLIDKLSGLCQLI